MVQGMPRIGSALLAVCLLFLFVDLTPALAARRIGLVLGNDNYHALPILKKAGNDARAVGAALREMRFDVVIEDTDLTRRETSQRLSELTRSIKPGDTVFFFFAGHGVSIGGTNYLLPVDLPMPAEGDEDLVRSEGHAAEAIVDAIRAKGAAVTFVVLDACRDNPFASAGTRGIGNSRGLGDIKADRGVFVLYSAGIGQKALDELSESDPEPNSVFTRTLVPLLRQKGLSQVALAKQVQSKVDTLAATINHPQQPAYYDQIVGELVLNEGEATEVPERPPAISVAAQEWKIVENSRSRSVIAAFRDKYSNDPIYGPLAEERLASLPMLDTKESRGAKQFYDRIITQD